LKLIQESIDKKFVFYKIYQSGGRDSLYILHIFYVICMLQYIFLFLTHHILFREKNLKTFRKTLHYKHFEKKEGLRLASQRCMKREKRE